MAFVRDIPALTAATRQLERQRTLFDFLNQANTLITRARDIPALYRDICDCAIRIDPRIVLAWIGMVVPATGEIRAMASAGSATGYLDGIKLVIDPSHPEGQGPTAQALRERCCVVVNDFAADPRTEPWRKQARRHGIAASIAIPLLDQGQAIGGLMLYSRETGSFDDEVVGLLVGLGENLSHAIDFAQQRRENDTALEALRRSEARYRLLAENVRDVIWVLDLETHRFVYMSPSIRTLTGYTAAEAMAQDLEQMLAPGSAAEVAQWIEHDIAAWQAGTYAPRTAEVEQNHRNGGTVWVEVNTQLRFDEDSGHMHVHGVSRDISERRAFVQQLAHSHSNLHAILDAASETIAMIAPDGRIIAINQIGASRFGSRPQALVGQDIYELLPPELAGSRKQQIDRALADGEPLTIDDSRNGRNFHSRVYPILGSEPRAVIYSVDITDALATERRVIESERRYRILFENSVSTMLIIDPRDGAIIDANLAASQFYGWSREQLRTMHMGEINTLPGEKVREEMAHARAEQRNHFQFQHRLADGTLRDVEVYSGPIQLDDKELLYSMVIDVTEQRRNTRRIQALLDISAMERSVSEEVFLTRGLELAEDLTASGIGFLHFVNEDQESIELVTWTAGALRGCTAAHDKHYPISQAGIWADCFREKRPVVFNDYPGYAFKHGLPPGHAHLQRLISVPVIEEDKVRMMIGVGNKSCDYMDADIETVQLIGNELWRIVRRERAEQELVANLTAQRELNRRLEEAHNQLLQSEKMASIGQLAAGVAHELNNPIGFVHSNLGTLESYLGDLFLITDAYAAAEQALGAQPALDAARNLKQAKDFDFLRTDIDQLMSESKDGLNRIKKIVQDLKDFSRVGETQWQWADVHQGLDSTLNIVWNELKYKCEIKKDYAADLPRIRCLPSQLNQVFMNLLVNAAQAIPDHGVISITTRVPDPENISITIRDTGSGIPPELMKRLFEPFFTTKPVGKGTGLGLSIAWGIIGKHRGRIDVESNVGVGTAFTICLPVDPGGEKIRES